ncbi:MAG: hypothetical protein IJO74_04715 [Clostridia bacterium]|nr:hypothetical protein [Clostridia bacterium]
MLDFLISILQLFALAVCLILLRALTLSRFLRGRIFRLKGKDYYFNNCRKNTLEKYLFTGFEHLFPRWLYLYNLVWSAFGVLVFILMFIGFAFGASALCNFALALFMYQALLALILALLYYIPPRRLVRKWCFFGALGAAVAAIPVTAVVWNICF